MPDRLPPNAGALTPLRRLYDEPRGDDRGDPQDAPPLAEAEAAELAALAPVKGALDALPPRRPDPAVLDATVAAATGALLGPVRALYDGGDDAEGAATAEAAALRPVKAALDSLPRRRPPAAVVDAVVAAAVATPAARPRAEDRPPERRRRRLGAVAGSLFALALVATAALWVGQEAPEAEVLVEAQPAADEVQAENAEEGLTSGLSAATPTAADLAPGEAATSPELAARTAAPRARIGGASAAPPGATPRPEAEAVAPPVAAFAAADQGTPPNAEVVARLARAEADEEALRLSYLRLEAMRGSGLGWDEPPAALGAPPDSTAPPAARGWMQVRVQR